MGEEDPV